MPAVRAEGDLVGRWAVEVDSARGSVGVAGAAAVGCPQVGVERDDRQAGVLQRNPLSPARGTASSETTGAPHTGSKSISEDVRSERRCWARRAAYGPLVASPLATGAVGTPRPVVGGYPR